MRRTEQRQGVRMLKLRDVLRRWEAGSLSPLEAAEIVGMSERSVRPWTRRFEEEGEDGLLDRRLGRRSGRAVPEDEADLRQAAASAAFATSRPLRTAWTRLRLAQPAHKQQQTKRSTYVLHKPDIFTCALQGYQVTPDGMLQT